MVHIRHSTIRINRSWFKTATLDASIRARSPMMCESLVSPWVGVCGDHSRLCSSRAEAAAAGIGLLNSITHENGRGAGIWGPRAFVWLMVLDGRTYFEASYGPPEKARRLAFAGFTGSSSELEEATDATFNGPASWEVNTTTSHFVVGRCAASLTSEAQVRYRVSTSSLSVRRPSRSSFVAWHPAVLRFVSFGYMAGNAGALPAADVSRADTICAAAANDARNAEKPGLPPPATKSAAIC